MMARVETMFAVITPVFRVMEDVGWAEPLVSVPVRLL